MNEVMKTPSPSQVSSFFDWVEDFWTPMAPEKKSPSVNIKNNDEFFHLEVAVPGFKKEDIKLDIANGYLNISSETKNETETKEENYTRREFSYSSFKKSFHLPENADENNIKASCKDGILKIDIGKTSKELPSSKQIEIK